MEPATYQLGTLETLKSIVEGNRAAFRMSRHYGNGYCECHVLGVLLIHWSLSALGNNGDQPAAFQALPVP